MKKKEELKEELKEEIKEIKEEQKEELKEEIKEIKEEQKEVLKEELKEELKEKKIKEIPLSHRDQNINKTFEKYKNALSIEGNYHIQELESLDNVSEGQLQSLQNVISDTVDQTISDFGDLTKDLETDNKFAYIINNSINNEIIGYCIFEDQKDCILIEVIGFSESYQRKYLSVIPFIIADQLAAERGYNNIKIAASNKNPNALNAYAKYCEISSKGYTATYFDKCKTKNRFPNVSL